MLKYSSCKVRSSTRTVVVGFLLYMRMLSTTTTITVALIPLPIPAAFIHRRCGYLVLAIRRILLPWLVLHHLHIQTELRRKPRIDVRLYGMLLRRHELVLLLLYRRIRRRKAELRWKLWGKWCIVRSIILPSCRRHHGRGRRQWSSRAVRRSTIFCPVR